LQCVAVCCSVLPCCSVLQCVVVCYRVLQGVAEWCSVLPCCSVLHYVAMCCNVLPCVEIRCRVLQCIAVCYSVLQFVAVCCSALPCVGIRCRALPSVAFCCIVLQCVAVCCSVLQCVAVCCTDLWEIWLLRNVNRASHPARRPCNILQHTATHRNACMSHEIWTRWKWMTREKYPHKYQRGGNKWLVRNIDRAACNKQGIRTWGWRLDITGENSPKFYNST